ncbi:MAG: hypothetical protein ACHQAQ_04885 [Hyphomicrobiales bacterium]
MRKILTVAFTLAGLVGTAFAASAARAQSPAALCVGKGTVDATTPIPASLVEAASRLFGGDPAFVKTSTVYRCMQDKVWLCNYGANLVCDKADTSRSNPGVVKWCREHPGSADIPMAATGHGTMYSWACAGNRPRITRVLQKVDARGYIADNWKLLP